MKRPTWATVIGILMIIFGVFGVLHGAQEMVMPSVMDMQKKIMTTIDESKVHDEDGSKASTDAQEADAQLQMNMMKLFSEVQEEFKYPEWFKSWSLVFGLISMVVGALYILSGTFLLMMKPFAIKLFYTTIGISVIWSVIQIVVYSVSTSSILLVQIPGAVGSIVIDIVLLVVVIVGNKESFAQQQARTV